MTMTGIDNIKPPINEKQLKFCYFGNWLVRTGVDVGTWKGVETANAQLAVLQGGVFRSREGARGAGGQCRGGCLTLLSQIGKVMIDPIWKEASEW